MSVFGKTRRIPLEPAKVRQRQRQRQRHGQRQRQRHGQRHQDACLPRVQLLDVDSELLEGGEDLLGGVLHDHPLHRRPQLLHKLPRHRHVVLLAQEVHHGWVDLEGVGAGGRGSAIQWMLAILSNSNLIICISKFSYDIVFNLSAVQDRYAINTVPAIWHGTRLHIGIVGHKGWAYVLFKRTQRSCVLLHSL